MAHGDDQEHDRLFTLSEANHLLPQLNARLVSVRQAKSVLARTKEDIRKELAALWTRGRDCRTGKLARADSAGTAGR